MCVGFGVYVLGGVCGLQPQRRRRRRRRGGRGGGRGGAKTARSLKPSSTNFDIDNHMQYIPWHFICWARAVLCFIMINPPASACTVMSNIKENKVCIQPCAICVGIRDHACNLKWFTTQQSKYKSCVRVFYLSEARNCMHLRAMRWHPLCREGWPYVEFLCVAPRLPLKHRTSPKKMAQQTRWYGSHNCIEWGVTLVDFSALRPPKERPRPTTDDTQPANNKLRRVCNDHRWATIELIGKISRAARQHS